MSESLVAVLPHVPNLPHIVQNLQHYVYNMLQIPGGLFTLVLHPVYNVPQIRQVHHAIERVGHLFYSAWGGGQWGVAKPMVFTAQLSFYHQYVCFVGGYIGLQNARCFSLKILLSEIEIMV